MPNRRIIAIWFPYMGAERILRKTQHNLREPIVVVANKSQSEIITSLCSVAPVSYTHLRAHETTEHLV